MTLGYSSSSKDNLSAKPLLRGKLLHQKEKARRTGSIIMIWPMLNIFSSEKKDWYEEAEKDLELDDQCYWCAEQEFIYKDGSN